MQHRSNTATAALPVSNDRWKSVRTASLSLSRSLPFSPLHRCISCLIFICVETPHVAVVVDVVVVVVYAAFMLHPFLLVFTLLCTEWQAWTACEIAWFDSIVVGSRYSWSSLFCECVICEYHIVEKHDRWVSHCVNTWSMDFKLWKKHDPWTSCVNIMIHGWHIVWTWFLDISLCQHMIQARHIVSPRDPCASR